MPDYSWPDASKRTHIGKRYSRLDGDAKVTGKAKYTHDVKMPGMIYARLVLSPHAHARVVSVDTSAAEKMPGVKAAKPIEVPGGEVQWAGQEVAVVAATDEGLAEDAARAVKVDYEPLDHLVREDDLSAAGNRARPAAERTVGNPDEGFKQADVVIQGTYSCPVITHCCMETHGSVSGWDGGKLNVRISTQAVSAIAQGLSRPLGVAATDVHVHQDHIGGGFGSKFGPDTWDAEGGRLAKIAGSPVKVVLDRAAELSIAGARPSVFARVKLGARKDGTLVAWESQTWGTGGLTGSSLPALPYPGWGIPNLRLNHSAIATNIGPSRAWRAPNHPQACYVSMCALEDLAAALKMDPLELFTKNLDLLPEARRDFYREELQRAAEMIEWKKKWHARGDSGKGALKRGLGLSLHTWGGLGHQSEARMTINADGSVAYETGSQDLGTGTRTAIAIVLTETLGLPLNAVDVRIGDSAYPPSGASGGSTTIGGVSATARRASVDALEELFKRVAPALNSDPANLESAGGRIQVKGDPSKSMTWKQACSRLGVNPISVSAKNLRPQDPLMNQGVAGVQMAEVEVDVETGVVRVQRVVVVQDIGLVISRKTAESQVYGAVIMGIAYSLHEEKIMDQSTGRMLNPNMEFYKLPGIGDIGRIDVEFLSGKTQDDRGVIGLGEPPVISPGAAIGNAVANAIGVRVPGLPMTPDRVLSALEQQGGQPS